MLIVIAARTGDGRAPAGHLIAQAPGAVTFDADVAHRLADIGVTSVAIAADEATEAVVLEGWAFDARTNGAEAASILIGDREHRALRPVLQTLLPHPTYPVS